MTEYITKERAQQLVIDSCTKYHFADDGMLESLAAIEKEPAADVAPVTYCKYCMYCQPHTDVSLFQYVKGDKMGNLGMYQHKTEIVCYLYGMKVSPRFYCRSGKRWGEEG